MIRDIQLQVSPGVGKEAPKSFELKFFFKFRKSSLSLWLSTGMTSKEIVGTLLDFIKKMLLLMEEQ